ncbi:DUF4912 domain-containing protein [Ferviditalea candida]|uniref:DUF4912 domain-containing protein n=1 Tax=Ferviditalea candida TaxID=3108399 RepID=A0ABU5ZFR4_9BACL|nr:DUF4912 domain-containing protein [Paenibacillaceae bacterium T2]
MNTAQVQAPIPTSGYEVPDRYHKDLLQLMVRDARTLYVYWEISNRRRWLVSNHFQCDWGGMPKILRVYDVTHVYFNGNNAHSHVDIELTPEAVNWYIHGVNSGATYVVDMGTYTLERQFIPLLRSNFAATPRNFKATWGEPIVSVVEEARQQTLSKRIRPHFFENFNAYSQSK